MCIGSDGWANIIENLKKAKTYCDHPFEIKHEGRLKKVVSVKGEWIGDHLNGKGPEFERNVDISCRNAAGVDLPAGMLDAVFADPPYFGNVQYAELMDFCYVWLRRLVGQISDAFTPKSTRTPHELTGNEDMGRGLEHFTEGLSAGYSRMANTLKPGSPLAFTYHQNRIEAYYNYSAAS